MSHPPVFEFSQPINNTSKNADLNNNKNHNRNRSTFDIFNLDKINFQNIKDINEPILFTNFESNLNNDQNTNSRNTESLIASKSSNNFELSAENEFKVKRKNRNKFYSEIKNNNNEIFNKKGFNLLNNDEERVSEYSCKKNLNNLNYDFVEDKKIVKNDNGINSSNNLTKEKNIQYGNLCTNKSANVNNNFFNKENKHNLPQNISNSQAIYSNNPLFNNPINTSNKKAGNYNNNDSIEKINKDENRYINISNSKKNTDYFNNGENFILNNNVNKYNRKNSNHAFNKNEDFDSNNEKTIFNNLNNSNCINQLSNTNSNKSIEDRNNYNNKAIFNRNHPNKNVNTTTKKNSRTNLLMDIIDENLNSANTNTLESQIEERDTSGKNKPLLNFSENKLRSLDNNSYENSNKIIFPNENVPYDGSKKKNSINSDNENRGNENSPFDVLNENPGYQIINNYNKSYKEVDEFRNETEENFTENNISPNINTEDNLDSGEQKFSDNILNLDYENYIKNNFRNSNTFESEQLKELREMESKGRSNNSLNLNLNSNNNILSNNQSKISPYSNFNSNFYNSEAINDTNYNNYNCQNYNNYESEFTEGTSINFNIDNYNNNKDNNNINSFSNINNTNKNNEILSTPKDSRVNTNSNSYSFTRNQTPNFFYSKGKIPINTGTTDPSLMKLNSTESSAEEFSENKANINVNRSNKILQNNFKKNLENINTNDKNNLNNLFSDLASKNQSFNPNFNFNSNSNFNFSNVNITKDPETISHVSNIMENESHFNNRLESKNFTLNYDENRLITLKPDEYVDTFENKLNFTGITFNSLHNNNFKEKLNHNKNNYDFKADLNYNYFVQNEYNVSSNDPLKQNIEATDPNNNLKINKYQNSHLNDDVYNMPLQLKKNKNYALASSKINDSYLKDAIVEKNPNSSKKKNCISEKFYDADRKPLAVFFSSKNDILTNLNDKRFNETFEKGNLNTFANNYSNFNNSMNQNYFFGNNENFYETLNSIGDVVNIDNNTFYSTNTDKKVRFFGQSNRSKKPSLDMNTQGYSNVQYGEKAKHKRNESYNKQVRFAVFLS